MDGVYNTNHRFASCLKVCWVRGDFFFFIKPQVGSQRGGRARWHRAPCADVVEELGRGGTQRLSMAASVRTMISSRSSRGSCCHVGGGTL